jgi:hypothetical protein
VKSNLVLSLLAILTLSGCETYRITGYQPSPATTAAIVTSRLTPVAVIPFTASKPGLASITCRAAGPVTVAPHFAGYIENAFIIELRKAGAYDPSSPIKISGKLEEIDFSTTFTTTTWMLSLTVSNAGRQSFTIKSTQQFEGSFFAPVACSMARDYFVPAVQQLLREVLLDPRFKQMTKPTHELLTQVFKPALN